MNIIHLAPIRFKSFIKNNNKFLYTTEGLSSSVSELAINQKKNGYNVAVLSTYKGENVFNNDIYFKIIKILYLEVALAFIKLGLMFHGSQLWIRK